MEYKPILIVVLILTLISIFLTLFINPFIGNDGVNNASALAGFTDFVENGYSFDLPVLGNMTFSPVTWLWLGISPVTNWVVDSLTTLTYIPDIFAVPIVILITLSVLFVVIFLISNLVPFT